MPFCPYYGRWVHLWYLSAGYRDTTLLCVLREWRTRWSWWLGSGALAGAASMLGFVVATKLTTAANAIFLVYTAPLYVALLSPWVLHEPIRKGDWLTLLLAVLGLGCFCGEQLTLAGWVGNGCALGSGLATAWLVVCLRKHAATSPLSMLLLANVLVAVAGVPWMVATMPDAVSGGSSSSQAWGNSVSRWCCTGRRSRTCGPWRPS